MDMVIDRTQADVDEALRIRREKVQKYLALTGSEIEVLEKGTITHNTLNRIEEKQETLKGILNSMGYWNNTTTNKQWNYSQIFNADELQRIFNNAEILRDSFFVYSLTPPAPKVSYDYKSFNDLEKILQDIDLMISDVKSRYKRCGKLRCGGVVIND